MAWMVSFYTHQLSRSQLSCLFPVVLKRIKNIIVDDDVLVDLDNPYLHILQEMEVDNFYKLAELCFLEFEDRCVEHPTTRPSDLAIIIDQNINAHPAFQTVRVAAIPNVRIPLL